MLILVPLCPDILLLFAITLLVTRMNKLRVPIGMMKFSDVKISFECKKIFLKRKCFYIVSTGQLG